MAKRVLCIFCTAKLEADETREVTPTHIYGSGKWLTCDGCGSRGPSMNIVMESA